MTASTAPTSEAHVPGQDNATSVTPSQLTLFSRVNAIPPPVFIVGLALLTLFRAGIDRYSRDASMVDLAATFPGMPETLSYKMYSVLGPAVAAALGIDDRQGWARLSYVVTASVLIAVAVLLYRAAGTGLWRWGLIAVSVCSIVPVLTQLVGHYDVWLVLSATLLVMSRNVPGAAFVVGLLLGLSGLEQAAVAVTSAVLVWYATGYGRVAAGGAALVGVVLAGGAVSIWLGSLGVPSRSGLGIETLGRSLQGHLDLGGLGVYSWYSMGWAVVAVGLVLLVRDRPRQWLRHGAAVLGLVLLPTVATLASLDGTRVFASVSWAALLSLLLWMFAENGGGASMRAEIIAAGGPGGILLGVMLLAPAYVTWTGTRVLLPLSGGG